MTDASSESKMVPSSSQPTSKEQWVRRPSGPNDIKRFRVDRKEDMDIAFEESRQQVITEEEDDEEQDKCKNNDEHEVHNSSQPRSDVFIVIDRAEATTELKQRLSRTSVCTSDVDIDRIVKESKTTTITETRETIHFRPRERSNKEDVCSTTVEIPIQKRLSILDSTSDERRARQTSPTTSTYRRPNASHCDSKTASAVMTETKHSDSVNDLAADYANLEKELQDINERNKELRKKFFEEKAETPVMGRSSPLPSISSRIQEWDSMSIRARERKKCTFAAPMQDVVAEPSKEQSKTSFSTSKQNGSSHSVIK